MSKRELWHPHVMGQIMLLSLVTSHELSMVIPLVGRLALFGGGLSLWSSMRGGLIQNREADEETPPTQRGREDLILTQGGVHDPPPTREGREKNRGEIPDSQQDRPKKSTRRSPFVGAGASSLPRGGDVGFPLPSTEGDPSVGILVPASSSLPFDTRGGVGPPTPFRVGGPFEGIIMCHPPPRRGMTDAWLLV